MLLVMILFRIEASMTFTEFATIAGTEGDVSVAFTVVAAPSAAPDLKLH